MRFPKLSFITLASVTALNIAAAQSPTRPSTFLGGALEFGAPQGDFSKYVHGAFGIGGHLIQSLDDDGIIAFRADLNILMYGRQTARQALGGGALSLIAVDVTTTNSLANGSVGLQLMAPNGVVRPYVTAGLGFSYFWTQSAVEGSDSNNTPFASTENYHDSGFATNWGGGLYIPVGLNDKLPISLDLGVQMHKNADIQYLTEKSITFNGSNVPPTIRAVRSSADYITFRLSVTVAVR